MDANALELFARIAQAGSFAQAARDLGLTRAAISRRIAAIENAVGLALFARSTRSLALTEAGRRLHARARAVRDAAESARLALRHTRDQLDGTIRISATASFGRHVLAPLLAGFQALHPAVRYELFFTDRRVDLLREGLDIAFRVTSKPPEAWVASVRVRSRLPANGSMKTGAGKTSRCRRAPGAAIWMVWWHCRAMVRASCRRQTFAWSPFPDCREVPSTGRLYWMHCRAGA